MPVPVVDLARRAASLEPEFSRAIARVIASGRFLLGAETEAFESELAAFVGRRFAVAVASGTDALRLSLTALGVGPGDEVILPAFTAVPTAAAVCATGAVPVPVDVMEDTASIDGAAAGRAVTEKTKAVVPVDLYGRPAELPEIGVPVVEDAAQAHGATAGEGAAALCFSFYPTKNLGGIGDGGAVLTDDAGVAATLRLLRHHGDTGGYRHELVATNSRLSEIEAAALRVGLARLTEDNRRRAAITARYREAAPSLRWQLPHPRHVYHLCVARVADRERFRGAVPFATAVHYPLAVTEQPAYRRFAREPCPKAEAWASECVTLPCFPEMTDEEIDDVCRGLASIRP